jgi:hypothetical protein
MLTLRECLGRTCVNEISSIMVSLNRNSLLAIVRHYGNPPVYTTLPVESQNRSSSVEFRPNRRAAQGTVGWILKCYSNRSCTT